MYHVAGLPCSSPLLCKENSMLYMWSKLEESDFEGGSLTLFFGSTSVKSLNGHGSRIRIWTWRWGGRKYRKSGMGPSFSSGDVVAVAWLWSGDVGYRQA